MPSKRRPKFDPLKENENIDETLRRSPQSRHEEFKFRQSLEVQKRILEVQKQILAAIKELSQVLRTGG